MPNHLSSLFVFLAIALVPLLSFFAVAILLTTLSEAGHD
jgi:hypothetical protein